MTTNTESTTTCDGCGKSHHRDRGVCEGWAVLLRTDSFGRGDGQVVDVYYGPQASLDFCSIPCIAKWLKTLGVEP